jgi:hypothetical protein
MIKNPNLILALHLINLQSIVYDILKPVLNSGRQRQSDHNFAEVFLEIIQIMEIHVENVEFGQSGREQFPAFPTFSNLT